MSAHPVVAVDAEGVEDEDIGSEEDQGCSDGHEVPDAVVKGGGG